MAIKERGGLVVSLLTGLFVALIYLIGVSNPFETSLGYDFSFYLPKNKKINQAIKIIGIDQRSLDMIGTFPWRRDLYTRILKRLGNQPKVIGFDILLSETSPHIEDDISLAEAISKSNRVVLPISIENYDNTNDIENFKFPLDELNYSASGSGIVNFDTDPDGIVRKTKVFFEAYDQDTKRKSQLNIFSYEIARKYIGSEIYDIPEIINCNFQGKEDKFQIYSFYDVLSGEISPSTFKDSIVLIGAMAEGLQDRLSSPIGVIDGVIYHAQLVSNILNRDYINKVPDYLNIFLIIVVSFSSYLIWKYFDTINQVLLLTSVITLIFYIHTLLFSLYFYISVVHIIVSSFLTFISLIILEQLKISKSLKLELDNLIQNYDKKNLSYHVLFENKKLIDEKIESNTNRIKKIADIAKNLTLERSFLETLLNNIELPITVTDNLGNIILANPSAENFFRKEIILKDKIDVSESKIMSSNIINIMSSFPEIKTNLEKYYVDEKLKLKDFEAERAGNIYKVKLFDIKTSDNEDNTICIIEDVTNWHIMANKDGLTNLWNQRYFKDYLIKEIDKSKRYKNKLSLIMMDVDHFKKFNDTYGHQTGDIVLKTVASLLIQNVRNTDVAARYGGEEFAIIMPMTDELGAKIFAERLRQKIADLHILDVNGNPVRQVTASLGVSSYEEGSISDFIEKTDMALYTCKERGRNVSTSYTEMLLYREGKLIVEIEVSDNQTSDTSKI